MYTFSSKLFWALKMRFSENTFKFQIFIVYRYNWYVRFQVHTFYCFRSNMYRSVDELVVIQFYINLYRVFLKWTRTLVYVYSLWWYYKDIFNFFLFAKFWFKLFSEYYFKLKNKHSSISFCKIILRIELSHHFYRLKKKKKKKKNDEIIKKIKVSRVLNDQMYCH
jgi:hypothetical protein